MKKLIVIVFVLSSINAFSQNKNILVPYLKNGKYGYANAEGKIIIPGKYESALPFYKNYDLSSAFNGKRSLVINRKGKAILKGGTDNIPEDSVWDVLKHFVEVPEPLAIREYCLNPPCPKFAIIEADDEQNIFDKMNNLYFIGRQGKAFLIDKKGKKQTEFYDAIKHYDFGEIEYCITEDHKDKKFGLLDDKGKEILTCVYDEITYHGKGVFKIRQGSFERDFKLKTKDYHPNIKKNNYTSNYKIKRKDGKSGIIDGNNQMVVSFTYDKLYPLNEDKFAFIKDDETGIVDASGNQIYKYNINETAIKDGTKIPVYAIYSRDLVFFRHGNEWHLIDLNGKQIGDNYSGVFFDYLNIVGTIGGVSINSKLGVIGKKGEYILKPGYEHIYCLKEDGSLVVKNDGKWNWLDSEGKAIYNDFEDFRYVLEEFLFVLKDGVWFYVSNKGKEFKD